MSGFEIAGVVLGALPLVISALEHYKSGKSVASALVQWRGHLDILIHRLKQQDTLFFLNLRELLDIAGIQELSAGRLDLTREECVKIFSFPETKEAMKESLGFLHETILDTLRRYEECLKKIVVKIRHIHRLDGASKDDLQALMEANPPVNGRFQFKKRFSFAIERSSLKALLEDLREDRLSLRDVCNSLKNHHGSPAREISREAVKLAHRLAQVRKRATSLYAALSSGGVRCKCEVQHRVMNQLQGRAIKSDSGNGTAFSLVLPLSGVDDMPPARIAAVLVEVAEELEPDSRHSDSTGPLAATQKKSAVRFRTPADHRTTSRQQTPAEKEARNICVLAREAWEKENQYPLRLRVSVDSLTMQPTSLAVDMAPFDKISAVVTLEDALAQGPQRTSGCMWLTPRLQSLLAVDIASSILQLQRTGWLCAPWSSQTIQFVIGKRAGKEAAGVFIRKDPILTRCISESNDDPKLPDPDPHVLILELSILLLELWHRTSIETWASSRLEPGAQPLKTSDTDSRFTAVNRWLKATYSYLTGSYLEVIEYCLGVYSGRPQSWDDEKFAQRYCQNIIMPLLQSSKVWPDG